MDGFRENPTPLVSNSTVETASPVVERWPGWLRICALLGMASLCWLLLAGVIILLARLGSLLLLSAR